MSGEQWRPGADLDTLKQRARVLAWIRAFFAERDVLEVETPYLSSAGTTDSRIDSFVASYQGPGAVQPEPRFLQTSPEFAMKRLLAAGSGAIYQIARVFRQGEKGRYHNPEFTMLEWYRPGFSLDNLILEVVVLIEGVLQRPLPLRQWRYGEMFQGHLNIDPHDVTADTLCRVAKDNGLADIDLGDDRDAWLDLLMSHCIEPRFDPGVITVVRDYPASQAALARVLPGEPAVANRFEIYLGGVELANGFDELSDAVEQARRFQSERDRRHLHEQMDVPMDTHLIAALKQGLPACCGVALGLDRLLMLVAGRQSVAEVMAFDWERA